MEELQRCSQSQTLVQRNWTMSKAKRHDSLGKGWRKRAPEGTTRAMHGHTIDQNTVNSNSRTMCHTIRWRDLWKVVRFPNASLQSTAQSYIHLFCGWYALGHKPNQTHANLGTHDTYSNVNGTAIGSIWTSLCSYQGKSDGQTHNSFMLSSPKNSDNQK